MNEFDLILTLNKETGEKEWQIPLERQEFENGNDDMYKIETTDSNGNNGELVVSKEHKIYFF